MSMVAFSDLSQNSGRQARQAAEAMAVMLPECLRAVHHARTIMHVPDKALGRAADTADTWPAGRDKRYCSRKNKGG